MPILCWHSLYTRPNVSVKDINSTQCTTDITTVHLIDVEKHRHLVATDCQTMQTMIHIHCTVLYCTIWGDHGSRGQYDNLWSALRPVQVGPLCKTPSVCKVCVFIDGAWQLLVTACVSLLRQPGLYVYSKQSDSLQAQASLPYTRWH